MITLPKGSRVFTSLDLSVYRFVAERIKAGTPPKLWEISDKFGWTTRSAAEHVLLRLEQMRLVVRPNGKGGELKLGAGARPFDEFLATWEKDSKCSA